MQIWATTIYRVVPDGDEAPNADREEREEHLQCNHASVRVAGEALEATAHRQQRVCAHHAAAQVLAGLRVANSLARVMNEKLGSVGQRSTK